MFPTANLRSRDWSIQLAVCLQKENAEMINNNILSIVGKKTIGQKTVNAPTLQFFHSFYGVLSDLSINIGEICLTLI